MKPRLPEWLKRRLPAGGTYTHTDKILKDLEQQTICTNANCPNRGQCWSRGTATVLILGNICTRNCKFCSVGHGKPEPPDPAEPARVAKMCKLMGLKYLVITSVDRDDLADGGASHFRDVMRTCRETVEGIRFELLVPDFMGCEDKALEVLDEQMPFVFGHNIETIQRLYPTARPGGNYNGTLKLLAKAHAKWPEIPIKSSMMLGLGEKDDEIIKCMQDLRKAGCNRIALGQYLKPSNESLDVIEYVRPEKFDLWAEKARQLGFDWVMSSPFTRSSYHAEQDSTP